MSHLSRPGIDNRDRLQFTALVALILVSAVVIRVVGGLDFAIQNDEQIWHERSVRFMHQLLGPVAPELYYDPVVYADPDYVDLTDNPTGVSGYPFNVQMSAHHPGIPMGSLIGLSILYLADHASSDSLSILTVVEAGRLPAVILGSLLPVLIFVFGRRLVGQGPALIAALLMVVEPTVVGWSKVARIDITQSLFCTSAVLFYMHAQFNRDRFWAVAAGISLAAGLTTNPYALYVFPGLVAVKVYTLSFLGMRRHFWKLVDSIDYAFAAAMLIFFYVFYVNIWQNPVLGIVEIYNTVMATPHVLGEATGSNLPSAHSYYVNRATLHLSPALLVFCGCGVLLGLISGRSRKGTIVCLCWGAGILVGLSVPEGRKDFKNMLILLPVVSLLAGIGVSEFLRLLRQWISSDKARVLVGVIIVVTLINNVHTTLSWRPFSNLYTWPLAADPQTMWPRGLVSGGEGVLSAIERVKAIGGDDVRIGFWSGENNALYYYPKDKIGSPNLNELHRFDWLVVLPKFVCCAPEAMPEAKWLSTRTPIETLRHHQIEIARIYKLDKVSR